MLQDVQNLFSDAQALAATAASTNLIDLSQARGIADGEPLAAVISVDVAGDVASGDETYQFTIQTDDSAGFASPMNLTTILFGALPSIPRAQLTAGSVWVLPFPIGQVPEQFVRLNYTLGGTTPSITVTAALMPMSLVQKYRSYAKGYTIS